MAWTNESRFIRDQDTHPRRATGQIGFFMGRPMTLKQRRRRRFACLGSVRVWKSDILARGNDNAA